MSTETLSRRKLFGRLARPAVVTWPQWMPRLAFAPTQTGPRGDVLLCVFLRGAADALNVIVPHGEDVYYRQRPTLAISRPDAAQVPRSFRAIDLDGFFGLHPAMAPLLEIWQAEQLAVIHAVGSQDESRSHFKAMELMERGVDEKTGPTSGWLGRHLASWDTGNHSPLRAVSMGEMVVHSLRGPIPATALRSIADFHLGGDPKAITEMQSALATLYGTGDPLDPFALEAMQTLTAVGAIDPDNYKPSGDAAYPADEFGMGLRQVAMLLKAEVGLEVACLDVGGWDTHIAQGGSEGLMALLLKSLAEGLNAFYLDLAQQADRLTIIVMSEFGRRVKENGGLGTDHGHGSAMLVLGGNIMGGRVHGEWPGLSRDQLVGPGDLAITTDYRDVLAEIILKRLNNPNLAEIFPEFEPSFSDVVRSASSKS